MEGGREREKENINTLYTIQYRFGGGGDWHKIVPCRKKIFNQSMQFTASEKFTLHNM